MGAGLAERAARHSALAQALSPSLESLIAMQLIVIFGGVDEKQVDTALPIREGAGRLIHHRLHNSTEVEPLEHALECA